MRGDACRQHGVGHPSQVGPIERPELPAGQQQDRGTARQGGDLTLIQQIAGDGPNALRVQVCANVRRRKPRCRHHASRAAGSGDGSMNPAHQRGSDLAAGAKDQDVAAQAGGVLEIGR